MRFAVWTLIFTKESSLRCRAPLGVESLPLKPFPLYELE
jgi:hypothetical protein